MRHVTRDRVTIPPAGTQAPTTCITSVVLTDIHSVYR